MDIGSFPIVFCIWSFDLKGTATLMISMFYQKKLYEPWILIQVSSKSVEKWASYGHLKNSIWPTLSRHFEYLISFQNIVIHWKHFIKYWPVWFEHCGYMWHICLPNASQSHVIRPIGWFNIVYQARHHMSLKRFQWKCHAENVFKNVLVQTISCGSVYGWIP